MMMVVAVAAAAAGVVVVSNFGTRSAIVGEDVKLITPHQAVLFFNLL